MLIEKADDMDRQALALPRAELWKKFLTPAQYAERNLRLYAHPYAKNHITTWLARDPSGNLLSSLDILEIELVGGESASGTHVASVYTPPAHRGHDYARELLKSVLLSHSSKVSLLFSDLRPSFYEKLGFQNWPVQETIEPFDSAPQKLSQKVAPISVDSKLFIAELSRLRATSVGSGVSIQYNELYLDWHLERYRYFSTLAGKHLPSDIFWIAEHNRKPHLLLIVPHYLTRIEEGLILTSECIDCLNFLKSRAADEGLSRIRYWAQNRHKATHHPMIRGSNGLEWVFQQPIDEW